MLFQGRKKKKKTSLQTKIQEWGILPNIQKKPLKHTPKLSKKIKEEGTLSKSLYEATKTLITNPDKDTIKKENYRSISLNIKKKRL